MLCPLPISLICLKSEVPNVASQDETNVRASLAKTLRPIGLLRQANAAQYIGEARIRAKVIELKALSQLYQRFRTLFEALSSQ